MPAAPTERKLAAILSADVVGYSRLMAEDEAGTIRTLTDYREAIRTLVEQHHGRVVDSPGDNLLAEFPNVLDAVQCAVETQRVLQVRNQGLAELRRMLFRIGVHLGDVTLEGERIYGDGVNIAARLEGLAEPGGICISATVQEQVESKFDVGFEDLGEQDFKNIPKPVRVYRVRTEVGAAATAFAPSGGRRAALAGGVALIVVAAALAAWRILAPTPEEKPPIVEEFTMPAIAVLAFDNLSGDPDQEYFADGMAEDLITRLSSWRGFPVIARNSSFTYKGEAVDVKRVGAELGARYVVEGSVRRAGERVRITAQLIDAATGLHVWSETYDRELRDIFAIQDEIAQTIVSSMAPELGRAEMARVARREPDSLDAYESFLRGNWHMSRLKKEHNAKARSFYERAAELDPHLAWPFVGLAGTHYADLQMGWSDSPERSLAELERAARRCIELDDGLAHCRVALAFFHLSNGDHGTAVTACERAIELSPSNPMAYHWLGWSLAGVARYDEAIASFEQAIRLSPRDPGRWMVFWGIAWAHLGARRHADAIAWAQRSLEHRADIAGASAYTTLAASYAHQGRLDDARAALGEALRVDPELTLERVRAANVGVNPAFLDHQLEGLRRAGLEE